MAVPRNVTDLDPGLGSWCILHGYRGSIAHGMYEPPDNPNSIDDKDTMAICVPPIDYYTGLREYGSRSTKEIVRDPWDIVIYECRKAVKMLSSGNPNILPMLWLSENYYIVRTNAGNVLIENRNAFVSRHAYKPFVGYANDQLYKMEHLAFEGYMGEKRKQLVEQHGYDTKNAAHLIRLLRMGIEFLTTGDLVVDRGGLDATELLAIKHGEWPLERVKEEAARLFKRAEYAMDRSRLPTRPDPDTINDICVTVIRTAHDERS